MNLLPGALESSTNVSEYVLPEVTKIFAQNICLEKIFQVLETMAVHLYAVGEAAVGRGVPLDLVTTEQPGTRLTINTTEAGGFHFRVEGFREEDIRLVKPGASSQHQDQVLISNYLYFVFVALQYTHKYLYYVNASHHYDYGLKRVWDI